VSKKNGRRVLKSVAKEVAGYRPDLKVGPAADDAWVLYKQIAGCF
jgi:hypothetical protein